METEMNLRAMMTVGGNMRFVFYTGSTHTIAETKAELMEEVGKWADSILSKEKLSKEKAL